MEIPDYLMKVGYLKKQDLKGSWRGMCYRLHFEQGEDKAAPGKLAVWCWPQPLCFEAADKEKMQSASFAFSQDGIDEAGRWLAERHEEGTAAGRW